MKNKYQDGNALPAGYAVLGGESFSGNGQTSFGVFNSRLGNQVILRLFHYAVNKLFLLQLRQNPAYYASVRCVSRKVMIYPFSKLRNVKFFKDKKRIVAAITDAELRTSGEIRLHVESYCPSSSLDRAVFVFNQLKMYKTRERNSVLIYLATESRKFTILGDTGINAVVPEGFWDSVREIMRQAFVSGLFTEGICAAVREIGGKLAHYFPYDKNDVDELSNEISFGE